jgi:hypothetical protein
MSLICLKFQLGDISRNPPRLNFLGSFAADRRLACSAGNFFSPMTPAATHS